MRTTSRALLQDPTRTTAAAKNRIRGGLILSVPKDSRVSIAVRLRLDLAVSLAFSLAVLVRSSPSAAPLPPRSSLELRARRGRPSRSRGKRDSASGATMSSQSGERGDVVGGGAINEKERKFGGRHKNTVGEKGEADGDGGVLATLPTSGYDPSSILSHTLHALAGMDRYPNYLSRWNDDDIGRLEDAMMRTLGDVRKQRNELRKRRDGISCLVEEALVWEDSMKMEGEKRGEIDDMRSLLDPPTTWEEVRDQILDERAAAAVFGSKIFKDGNCPSVEDVLGGGTKVELDPAFLENWLDQEMFDTYSLPLLREKVRH